MNVLEKILEEIEQEAMTNKEIGRKQCEGMIKAMDIIRFHINEVENDGWIPVEERLPEETDYYLVQSSRRLPNEDYSDRVVVLYNGEEKKFTCYSKLIIAWQPLPEPYRLEEN